MTHSTLNESETRYTLIDPQLKKAGWNLADRTSVGFEIPVQGYDASPASGITDYCLYRSNGEVLAVIEAKRTRRDAKAGKEQVLQYITEIAKKQGFRPFAFMTNGDEVFFWDSEESAVLASILYNQMKKQLFLAGAIACFISIRAQINPQNVTIARDSFGVPHIYGKTDADAAYGLAWAHSEDDFEHIQHNLLAGKGMLGEVLGKEGVLFDFGLKFLAIDSLVEQKYESDISADFKKVLQGYAQGINDYASAHPKEVLLKKAFPITEKDLIKGYTLQGSLLAGLGMALKAIRDNKITEYYSPNDEGSNALAIAPNRTEDKSAWLLINSHQPIEGRFAWYEAHIRSDEGWNIIGGLFPGGVSAFVGTNEYLG